MFNRRKVPQRVRNRRRTKIRNRKLRIGRRLAPSWYPFGKSRTCKLRYCENIAINPALGTTGTYTFAASGLYDPNISGTGHQPYGFDQLMALYNKYHVTGSKIRVTLIGGGSTPNCIFGVKLCDLTTMNTSDPQYALEQPGFSKKIFGNGAQTSNLSVSKCYSARKFFRRKSKSDIIDDDTLGGTSSANPNENAFFIIVLAPVVSSEDIGNFTIQVQIDYVATFTGPKELSAS